MLTTALSASSTERSPPTVSISTSATFLSVASPPTLCRTRSAGELVTSRSPPRFVSSIASPTFSNSASPEMSLSVTSPATFSNSTRRIPSISASPATFVALMLVSSGTVNSSSPSQSMMVSVLPSCSKPPTASSVSTLIACSFQTRTLKSPCTCVIITRGALPTVNVCWFINPPCSRSPIYRGCPQAIGPRFIRDVLSI